MRRLTDRERKLGFFLFFTPCGLATMAVVGTVGWVVAPVAAGVGVGTALVSSAVQDWRAGWRPWK